MFLVVRLKRLIAVVLAISLCLAAVIIVSNASGEEEEDSSIKLPVIMYHGVLDSEKKAGKFVIQPKQLEEDLKYLKDNGYQAVVIQDLYDYVYEDKPLPEKPVMLTFDDGYYNNYVYAYPLMKKYDMKMVLSIVGRFADEYTELGENHVNYSHATWDQLKEMQDSGYVEIQNHSYNMHSIDKKRNGSKKNRGEDLEHYKKFLNDDIGKLQKEVEEHLGKAPLCFTYPFGSVSNASFDILKEMGFKATLSCEEGINKITKDPECLYMLDRYIRPANKSVEKILK